MKRKIFGVFNGIIGMLVLYSSFRILYLSQFPKRYFGEAPPEPIPMQFNLEFFSWLACGLIFVIATYYVFKSMRSVKFILGTTLTSIGSIIMLAFTVPEFYYEAIVQSRELDPEFYIAIALNIVIIYFGIKLIRSSKK